ncbi:hypothetical protein ACMWQW_29715, partial [Escherichia coli]
VCLMVFFFRGTDDVDAHGLIEPSPHGVGFTLCSACDPVFSDRANFICQSRHAHASCSEIRFIELRGPAHLADLVRQGFSGGTA